MPVAIVPVAAVAGAMGVAATATVAVVATAAINGLIVGAVIGAATAAISGGNIFEGAIKGAVIGGVTAGVFSGLSEGISIVATGLNTAENAAVAAAEAGSAVSAEAGLIADAQAAGHAVVGAGDEYTGLVMATTENAAAMFPEIATTQAPVWSGATADAYTGPIAPDASAQALISQDAVAQGGGVGDTVKTAGEQAVKKAAEKSLGENELGDRFDRWDKFDERTAQMRKDQLYQTTAAGLIQGAGGYLAKRDEGKSRLEELAAQHGYTTAEMLAKINANKAAANVKSFNGTVFDSMSFKGSPTLTAFANNNLQSAA